MEASIGTESETKTTGGDLSLRDGWSGYGTTPLPVASTYKENGGGGNKMTALTLKLKRHFYGRGTTLRMSTSLSSLLFNHVIQMGQVIIIL